ncbi:MAG: MEMO1 family protein [Thiomicrorhabdus sp.]|nr:MAG: MEMO1 family protein [Thiomicrorhabdus sp.]
MTTVRETAVAGQFYPDNANKLTSWFNNWMKKDWVKPLEKNVPRALIVPHAGYKFSGLAAARGFKLWQDAADKIKTVVVMGPAHRMAFEGVATVSVDQLATPLGSIEVDSTLRDYLLSEFAVVALSDAAQEQEHSIEVQLPFIKYLLPDAKVLPLLNGQVEERDVTAFLKKLWRQEGVYFVISSDLSHFESVEQARKIDGMTAEMINKVHWLDLSGERACGYKGIQGLLGLDEIHPEQIQQLELINSGSTGGDKNRVVGYGTWAIFDEEEPHYDTAIERPLNVKPLEEEYSDELQGRLLQIAKRSIEYGLQTSEYLDVRQQLNKLPPELQVIKGAFVTLEKRGQLRGCIGTLQAIDPLAEDVASNAFNAAFKDPRFPPLTEGEAGELEVSISVLTSPVEIPNCQTVELLLEQLTPNKDGLIISDGVHRATFLPSVWEQLPDKNQFISHLMQKAGMRTWSENMRCERYYSISFAQQWDDIQD